MRLQIIYDIRKEDLIFIFQVFRDNCLHFYCYIYNVSADMSSGLLPLLVDLESLHGTSNNVLYLIHGVASSDFVNHNRL